MTLDPTSKLKNTYPVAVAVATVGAAFSAMVTVGLLWAFVQMRVSDPRVSMAMDELRGALARHPEDAGIKTRVAELDQQLRQQFALDQHRMAIGAYLLLAGLAVTLAGSKWVIAARRKLPMPGAAPTGSTHEPLKFSAAARWGVAAVAIVGVGIALAAALLPPPISLGPTVPVAAGQPGQTTTGVSPASTSSPAPTVASEAEVAKNWPMFRGPGGRGVSAYTNYPDSFDVKTGKNVLWKTPLPLPGESSAVAWGNKVFVAGADRKTRKVFCFSADDGKLLWEAPVKTPDGPAESPDTSDDTGYAPSTPATDGQRVYAIFTNGDLAAFDFAGKQVWARNLGAPTNTYGHAASLAVAAGKLIVQYDQGAAEDKKSELIALEAATGKTAWVTPRPMGQSWSTPIVIPVPAGGQQVITCGNPTVIAYDLATGDEIWSAECMGEDMASTPTFGGGLVIAVNKYAKLTAIRPDGKGDVAKTHIAWTAEDDLPDISSPLATDKRVYIVSTPGTMSCYSMDGTKKWVKDLPGGNVKASPSLVGQAVWVVTVRGEVLMLADADEFKPLGTSNLGEACDASPAFMDGKVIFRGEKNLICVAKPK